MEGLAAAALTAGSSVINTIGNAWGTSKSNKATKKMTRESNMLSAQMANQQMAFQERMSNTAIQRQVADAKMAGVNPLFAVGGGGASSPSGAMGSTTSGGAMQAPEFDMDIGGAVSAYSRIKTEKAQRKIMEEQTKNEVKTGSKIEAETDLTKTNKEVAKTSIKNLKANTKQALANATKAEAEAEGIKADNTLKQLKSDSLNILTGNTEKTSVWKRLFAKQENTAKNKIEKTNSKIEWKKVNNKYIGTMKK